MRRTDTHQGKNKSCLTNFTSSLPLKPNVMGAQAIADPSLALSFISTDGHNP